jgi:hypothetical protein
MAEDTDQAAAEAEAKAARDRAIAAIPALYADTWHVYTWTGHMRLTFGEIFRDLDNFRNAVVMPIDDAEALAQQMLRMIERRKKLERERAARAQEDKASES